MKVATGIVAVAGALCLPAAAQANNWTTYRIPETGTTVDIPAAIFTQDSGKPDGEGQRFRSADGRADLTIQAVPRTGDSPAAFLAKKKPPPSIVYKRITSRFSSCPASSATPSGTTAATSRPATFIAC